MSKKEKKNPGYVKTDVFNAKFNELTNYCKRLEDTQKKILNVLIGKDMDSGIVGKLRDLSNEIKTGKTIVGWIKPIVIAVASSFLTAVFLTAIMGTI